MSTANCPLISPEEVKTFNDVVIVDARSGPEAHARFMAGHLSGAVHADLDTVLTALPDNPAFGGRHPLPDLAEFRRTVGTWGIVPGRQVIVYDDKNGAFAAARFWWMMRALGHDKVQVVDGGLGALIRAGIELTKEMQPLRSSPPYPADSWLLPTVELDDVDQLTKDPASLIIDVREAFRFIGEREPIDLIAGHIPGAVNVPYLKNLDATGSFLPADELAALYKSVLAGRDPSRVVVHCGSGVTACHTLLALEQAGLPGAGLYVGSWSEWSRRDMPIARGNE